MAYYTYGLSYSETDEMAPFERVGLYNRLVKRKKDEKEAQDKARNVASVKRKK